MIVAPIIALPILIVVFVVLIVSSKRRSRITAKLSIKIPGGEEDEENI